MRPLLIAAGAFWLFGWNCHLLHAEDVVKKLLIELDNDDFNRREQAQKQLRQLGTTIVPDLQSAVQNSVNLELRTRVQALLKQIEKDAEEKELAERRRKTFVRTYYVKDLLDYTSDIRGPGLTFGSGGIEIEKGRWQGENNIEKAGQQFVSLVRSMVDAQSWDNGRFNAALYQNVLVVSQSPDGHERVESFLNSLRAETHPQIAVSLILVQAAARVEKSVISGAELEAIIKDAAPDAIFLRSRILCSNLRRSVAMEGKQIEYLGESFNYANGTNGARAQQGLQGYSFSVLPKMNRATGDIGIELQFSRNTNLQMRAVGALERFLLEANTAKGKERSSAAQEKQPGADQADGKQTQWMLPSADLQAIQTDVVVHKGTWSCVGRLGGGENQQNSEKKGLYLFLSAEVIDLPASAPH